MVDKSQLPDLSSVVLRGLLDDDRPYVVGTWLKSQRSRHRDIPYEVYAAQHAKLINHLLDTEETQIVCPTAGTWYVAGFACGRLSGGALLLHCVNVRNELRRAGVAKYMLRALGWTEGTPVVATHWCRLATELSERYPLAYDPYKRYSFFHKV